ncbi:hypothetical protein L2E82_33317 [Cichorium intybus]|uniref:Uncharacterized protein n=1 Tax=Cichorium intybus TaxID=13427 RepID=A0ACB9BJT9_CICIN|nr:hypothetical protein L2E82_33317 [Cichorium intybus]
MVLLSSLIYAKIGCGYAKILLTITIKRDDLQGFNRKKIYNLQVLFEIAESTKTNSGLCLLPSSPTIFCKTRGPNFTFSRPPTIVSPPVINTLASLRRFFFIRFSGEAGFPLFLTCIPP